MEYRVYYMNIHYYSLVSTFFNENEGYEDYLLSPLQVKLIISVVQGLVKYLGKKVISNSYYIIVGSVSFKL